MRRAVCLGGIWLTTLVATAGITWKMSSRADLGAEVVVAPLSEVQEVSSWGEEDASDELIALREELESLKARHEALSDDYVELSRETQAEEKPAINTDLASIANLWERQFDAIRRGNDSFTIESRCGLLFAFATYGEAGVGYLNRIIEDRRRSLSERETALFILRYIATPRALETLLAFRDPGLTQLDYPYDLINFQLKMIRTEAIRHHIPGIISQIDEDLGTDDFSPERVEVLLTLASTHGDVRARELLRDPRIYQENLDGAIHSAETMDTAIADEFLLDLAQNHETEYVRQSARRAYAQ